MTYSNRPTWHKIWMQTANLISERSHDKRTKVGAVIVARDNSTVLSLGYNGNYSGGEHEPESITPGESGFLHAEVNALIKAPFHYPIEKIMYVTVSPCRACAKLIINAGISEVIYDRPYRDDSGIQLLLKNGIKVYHMDSLHK
jgi:dCMP deaminase